jgi:hypothetical protein
MVPRCSTDTTYAIYEFKVIYLFILNFLFADRQNIHPNSKIYFSF